jgi:hypothetical protein
MLLQVEVRVNSSGILTFLRQDRFMIQLCVDVHVRGCNGVRNCG